MSEDRQKIKKLQEEFITIIALIPIMKGKDEGLETAVNTQANDDSEEIEEKKKRALEIINELKDHINDHIELPGCKARTVLDYVIFCNNEALDEANRKVLKELETATRKAGGKLSSGKPISFLAKCSVYAMLPMATLSFCSTLCFVTQSVVAGGDIRIAGCLSIFGLLVCIGLGSIVKKSGVLREERLRRIEDRQIEEESDKMIKLYVTLSPACLLVSSIFTGLVALVSFAVVLGQDITGNNAQAALSSFMFGSLISVLGIGAACIVIMDRLDITMGQLVDVITGQQSIISVSMESSSQRQQASLAL